ncbi:hypothetical protein [Dactylosporangium sp. NPDC051484]|uniref:hypothetical protein n=1 Tax=Dactylosporangium sp. NPDC051484 TaxID=3154942 RepID=UPI00344CB4FE
MHAIKAAVSAPRKPVLAIGEQIAAQVERTSITLQRVTANTWTVTVYQGVRRIDDQCATFENEQAAALTASAYYQLAVAETLEPAADPAAPLAPGEIREHVAGPVVIRVFQTAQAGVLVQGRRNGRIDPALCSRHDFDTLALRRYADLVAAHPAA